MKHFYLQGFWHPSMWFEVSVHQYIETERFCGYHGRMQEHDIPYTGDDGFVSSVIRGKVVVEDVDVISNA